MRIQSIKAISKMGTREKVIPAIILFIIFGFILIGVNIKNQYELNKKVKENTEICEKTVFLKESDMDWMHTCFDRESIEGCDKDFRKTHKNCSYFDLILK
jgi:hypothetical protein